MSSKPVSWPAPGTGAAVIPTATTLTKASRLRAGPSAGSARAGGLPVSVGPPDTTSSSGHRRAATDAYLSQSLVTRVTVAVASQATASALGVRGVILTVARADGRAGAGRVHVSLDYSAFADSYDGNHALPDTPGGASGLRADHRDASAAPAILTSSVSSPELVLAALATQSGSGGNYAAEPVSEAYDWVTG